MSMKDEFDVAQSGSRAKAVVTPPDRLAGDMYGDLAVGKLICTTGVHTWTLQVEATCSATCFGVADDSFKRPELASQQPPDTVRGPFFTIRSCACVHERAL